MKWLSDVASFVCHGGMMMRWRAWRTKAPLITGVLALLLSMYGAQAWAKFEFTNTDGGFIDLETYTDTSIITYTFTVRYRACKEASCSNGTQANYRLAISDQNAPHNDGRLDVSYLTDVMSFSGNAPRAQPGGKNDMPMTPKGEWTFGNLNGSGFDHGHGAATEITATFTIELNNMAELQRIAQTNDPFLRFDVHGQLMNSGDNSSNHPYDQSTVAIRLNFATFYRVSGVQDLMMDSKDFIGQDYYSNQMSFCIYASQDPRDYWLDIRGDNASQFTLKNGTNEAPYEILFSNSITGLNNATPHSGRIEQVMDNGHANETCNGYTENNAAIRVRVKKDDVSAIGVYTDTVYVRVSAL